MREPRAKKSLGQNFLQDQNIARKIVAAVKIRPEDRVIEIGPGPGMLTRFILEARPASLTLVEKDDDLARAWAEEFSGQAAGEVPVTVLHRDAMTVDWAAQSDPVKVAGNLPYNVASPLMWDILSQASGLTGAVFMVQKEVAERLVARPATSAYGALSVWVQSFSRPKLEFVVPPQVFRPRPKVHSAVVSFEPLPASERTRRKETLSYLLKLFFRQRRKQLGGILRAHGYAPEILHEYGIEPSLRPENLSVEVYRALSEKFLINTQL